VLFSGSGKRFVTHCWGPDEISCYRVCRLFEHIFVVAQHSLMDELIIQNHALKLNHALCQLLGMYFLLLYLFG
jgi:hypothetical protein